MASLLLMVTRDGTSVDLASRRPIAGSVTRSDPTRGFLARRPAGTGPLSSLLTAAVMSPGVGAGAWTGFVIPQGPSAASSNNRSEPIGIAGGLPAAAAAGASASGLAVSVFPNGPAAADLVAGSWPGGTMPGGGRWQDWIAAAAAFGFQADPSVWPDGVLTRAAASATSSAARLDEQVPIQGMSTLVGPPLLDDEVDGHLGCHPRLQLLLLHLSTSTSLMKAETSRDWYRMG